MLEQVNNFEQEIEFVVGFAGSGKSTELSKRANNTTLVVVPTHKAASVLMGKGVENVYTIHATLGLVPTLNQNYVPGKQKMQRLKRVGNTDLADISAIFIDEFGMIPQYIMDLLLEVLPDTTKVTVFGDPYQLPPVDGEPIDPLIYTNNITELTTQYRAEAPEVVETFMRFMSYIKDGSEHNLKMNPAIKHGTLKGFNPMTDRVLAYTNARVASLNLEIADILEVSQEYYHNDDLIANQINCLFKTELALSEDSAEILFPNCISKGRLMDTQELIKQAKKTMRDIEKYNTLKFLCNYEECLIMIEDTTYAIYYDIDHYATQQRLKADIDQRQSFLYNNYTIPEDVTLKEWCYKNKSKEGVKERGQAWSHYIAHSSLVFNLQRPWATTVHKAQGSEFSTVYIAQEDIKKSIRQDYYMDYARLMYVALSRAIKEVVIV